MNAFETLINLDELTFIAGTKKVLQFTVTDSSVAVDLDAYQVKWQLFRVGSNVAILTKTGTKTGLNTYEVTLDSADTAGLYGKFVQQPYVIDPDSQDRRVAQGYVTIGFGKA